MRFKKYDTNWDRKKLSDYVKKITRKNSNNVIKNVICNSAQNGLIPQLDFFDKEIANNENTAGYYIISNGDFVYNPRKSLSAPYGPVNIYKYDSDGIVSPLYLCFSVDDCINKSFLLQRFKSPCWYRYIYLNGDSGARHDRVSIKDEVFLSQPINLPNAEEQAVIAEFLEKIDERISVQNKIISKYETLIKGIRERVVSGSWQWKKLDELIQEGIVRLNRGNIIPKHQKDNAYKYPVYSSSTQNNGLMGYNDTYMFDKELITWSIDGGGNFFYRKKHKFNVTNVCGILQVDENVYSYRFIAEMLTYQHSKMKFDYQSKAHPSVISSLYSLPCLPISEQNSYCRLFIALDKKMQIEQCCLNKLKEQKKYLLSKMFI